MCKEGGDGEGGGAYVVPGEDIAGDSGGVFPGCSCGGCVRIGRARGGGGGGGGGAHRSR